MANQSYTVILTESSSLDKVKKAAQNIPSTGKEIISKQLNVIDKMQDLVGAIKNTLGKFDIIK